MLNRMIEVQESLAHAYQNSVINESDKQQMENNKSTKNSQEDKEEEKVDTTSQDNQSVKEFGQLSSASDSSSGIHCITIIGQVEGHVSMPAQNKTTKYEHLIPQLVGLSEDSKVKGLLVILNTVGGDVEAGLALAELISSFEKPVVSLVLGGAHSIGVPIAVASDYSYITPSATMTLHPVRMNGTVLGVAQTFEYFDQIQERIVEFVAHNSGITADRFRELMLSIGKLAKDMGTILVGKQAVDEKLIDELGGLSDALKKLREIIEEEKSDEE